MTSETVKAKKSQLDKFKQAAREHGTDESEAHWDERLKRVVKAKPSRNVRSDDKL